MNSDTDAPPPTDGAAPDARVAEIEGRLEAATEGPWAWANTGEKDYSANVGSGVFAEHDADCESPISGDVTDEHGEYYVDHGVAELHSRNCAADARFIAHARQDIPWLLSERARLLAENAALREELRRTHGAICPTHGEAVLMCHVSDGEACSDYLLAAAPTLSEDTDRG